MEIDVRIPKLTDPHGVQDVFACGLGEVEDLGGCFRFTLYAEQQTGGRQQCFVTARVIVPRGALPAILYVAARTVGLSLVRPRPCESDLRH